MIKFFRKIRKKLIEQSKVRSYFFYAIGEIVLVVIGILIALSINNWNEGRKTKQEELVILKNLVDDLNTAKIQSEVDIRKDSITVHTIISVLKDKTSFFEKYTGSSADSIAFEIFWNTNPDTPVINSYSDIKSSGKLSVISSKEIKDRLTLLEKSINNLSYIMNDLISVHQIRIDEIAVNDLNFERLSGQNLSITTEFDELEVPYTEVLENKKIRNLLSMKLSLISFVLDYRKKLLKDINSLTLLIDSKFNTNND